MNLVFQQAFEQHQYGPKMSNVDAVVLSGSAFTEDTICLTLFHNMIHISPSSSIICTELYEKLSSRPIIQVNCSTLLSEVKNTGSLARMARYRNLTCICVGHC